MFFKQYIKPVVLATLIIIIGATLLVLFTQNQSPARPKKAVYTPGISSIPKKTTNQNNPLTPSQNSNQVNTNPTPTSTNTNQPSQLANTGPGDLMFAALPGVILCGYVIGLRLNTKKIN